MEKDKFLSIENLLNQTCSVQYTTTSAAATGGVINTFANRINSLPCLLNQRKTSREVIEFGKVTMRDVNVLYTPITTSALTIISSDRITIGSRTFEIVKTPYNPGNRSNHLQIEVEEIT